VQNRIRNLQALAIGLAFGFLIPVFEKINSSLNSEDVEIDYTLFLPTVILWCEYLGTLTDLLSQLCNYSKSIDKENLKASGMFLMVYYFKIFRIYYKY
jgi:hypothetical protein